MAATMRMRQEKQILFFSLSLLMFEAFINFLFQMADTLIVYH
jgi:hypothetical protein